MADEEDIESLGVSEVVGEEIESGDLIEIVEAEFDPEADVLDDEEFDPETDVLTVGSTVVDGQYIDVADAVIPDIDEGSTIAPVDPTSRKASEDVDDDDDDLRTEDDVEADLSSILQEKLASPQETAPEDEEETIGDDRTDGVERLQPRRPDETQCTHCFLLVRQTAPGCPVEDDACPLFVH